ncbi:AraC family transcriptional regulator [Facklamia sp. DSM 111018]|uniref:AraC family transcriptional regulator n=1 Tax=Facklamia lactis TaxID=2749967 RepID=A0ABS0LPW7_9LACT|nr:helix-turn-helix domain-containing protein [Facklamia lactis]MBG9979966.1 AraC family transcriptional regulator [Facklamia lactis]MBG9985354.1 AraC family transcriptional regulator [Facklamia lactis]
MYNQTTDNIQNSLFTTVKYDDQQIKPFNRLLSIKKNHSDALLKFTKPVTLTECKGLALLVITDTPEDSDSYHYYILQNAVRIQPNTYFNTLALTPECKIYLEPTQNEDPQIMSVKKRIQVNRSKANISIDAIYSLHYQVYSSGESLKQPSHDYYELLIIDQGEAKIYLNQHTQHILSKNQAWLKSPGQKHQMIFKEDSMSTLISILFHGQGINESISQRPVKLGHRQIQLIERLISLSNQTHINMPYYYDEMLASLQLIIAQMLNGDHQPQEDSSTSMRENYENELFQSIVEFLQEQVHEQHQVNDLVEHFNISRSSLQSLFKKYTSQTPKAYINSLRLKRSKLLIHESKMTLSEIASELGYGSIQYFSRAFSKEFGISPSTYAKSILK